MTCKVDLVYQHMLRKLKNVNQPQIFGLPRMHKEMNVKRTPGGGSFIDNALGNIRRARKLIEIGSIGTGKYYVFSRKALNEIKKNPRVLRDWIAGKKVSK